MFTGCLNLVAACVNVHVYCWYPLSFQPNSILKWLAASTSHRWVFVWHQTCVTSPRVWWIDSVLLIMVIRASGETGFRHVNESFAKVRTIHASLVLLWILHCPSCTGCMSFLGVGHLKSGDGIFLFILSTVVSGIQVALRWLGCYKRTGNGSFQCIPYSKLKILINCELQ